LKYQQQRIPTCYFRGNKEKRRKKNKSPPMTNQPPNIDTRRPKIKRTWPQNKEDMMILATTGHKDIFGL
jgi:hypothetical protein